VGFWVDRLRFVFQLILLLCCLHGAALYAQQVRIPALPLGSARDLDTLVHAIGDARIVLLGEASHGTAEYYQWRSLITQRLIREKGFKCIAVEGEWADCFRVNNFIKGPLRDSVATVSLLQQFNRWPAWMWANRETAQLVRWLNTENQGRAAEQKVGFYGLDLYCVWESIAALTQMTDGEDTALRHAVEAAYQCFTPYGSDAMAYASALMHGAKGCGYEAGHLWGVMKSRMPSANPTEEEFASTQYALVAEDGERYFHNIGNGIVSWNLRENHMYTTIRRLLALYGADSKIIVWAHNTHVGDARSSTMSTRHKVSIGQLLREAYGDRQVFITGFGSYSGTLLCGRTWGDSTRLVTLPPARGGSWEDLLHSQYGDSRLVMCSAFRNDKALNGYYATRAVGAIYRPASDAYSSYTSSVMSRRYDAFIYLDKTEAVHPLPVMLNRSQVPYTFPTGF
jgi:erythromycin esterase